MKAYGGFGETDIERGNVNDNVQRITVNIQQLNQNVQTLGQYVDRIGEQDDDEQMRNAMKELIQKSNHLSKTTNSMIKDMMKTSNGDRQLRVQSERLTNDYMSVLNRLQSTQRKAVIKEKAQIKSVVVDDEELRRDQQQPDSMRLQQIQEQHRINLNEIKERQQALSELEQDIGDINQIFKDLAHIVHDQGEMVDSIEANVEHAQIHVSQGHTNVSQALHYQTKARQKKMILSAFCFALLLILILAVYLWLR